MRRTLFLATILAASLPATVLAQRDRDRDRDYSSRRHSDHRDWLADCRDNVNNSGDRDRVKYCEERTMGWPARPGLSLAVDASPNGGISVTGWDRDSVNVVLHIQTQAGSDSEARELAQSLHVVNENGRLSVNGPSSRRWSNWSVSFEIQAPRHVDVDLSTVNGPLEIADITGRLRMDAENGPLAIDRVAGDVHARAQNGPLTVELAGTKWEGAGLDAETQNGPVELTVPEGYNAELETGTVNGPMDIGFPVTVQGRIGAGNRRRIQTTLGSGGPAIRVVTTNGPATIRKS
ncbi:MAG TPA: hypothetical protein VGI92_02055 [Gemmatimonadales bacterium]|jgi:DUF4097 and DUF4098 domain-containing protein YvlB